jgi:voltage-gated potassium channel Kch
MNDEDLDALHKEHITLRRQTRALAGVALGVLAAGAVFFHHVEHFKWLDSFYFCTITLTTVGYGDIVPKTNAGKLFDMFYVLIGIGIIATFANILIKSTMVRRQLKQATKRNAVKSNRKLTKK